MISYIWVMIRGIIRLESYSISRAEEMLEEIKAKRERMIEFADKHGFTGEETIKASQELDELINEYQRTFHPLSKPKDDFGNAFIRIFMIWVKSFFVEI
jgi:stage 0 sporulation regulatory protein